MLLRLFIPEVVDAIREGRHLNVAKDIAREVASKSRSPREAYVLLDGGVTFRGREPEKVAVWRCPLGESSEVLCRFHRILREEVAFLLGAKILHIGCRIDGKLIVWRDTAARAGVGMGKLRRVLKRNACLFAIEHFRQ